MTNGEKIKEIFPNGVLTSISNSYYWGNDILVSKSCWNAEYKEPTRKTCNLCGNFGSHNGVCDICNRNPKYNDLWREKQNCSEIPTSLTTKNDLVVDCIDRAELLKAMDTWDKFGYTTQFGLERLDKDDKDFVPYVRYGDMVKCVKRIPSVTPIRPKGHWIKIGDKGFGYSDIVICKCSECEYQTEFVGKFDGHNLVIDTERADNYCSNCGSDNRDEE